MDSNFVFLKKAGLYKRRVNKRYAKMLKHRYINQTKFKNNLFIHVTYTYILCAS